MNVAASQMDCASAPAKTIIFDLDGTLTRSDTLLPFLSFFVAARPSRAFAALWSLASGALAWLWGSADRDSVKERLIVACVRGATRDEVQRHVERLVSSVVPRGLHQDALAVLEEHRRLGHRVILLSASPDVYVSAIAHRLGFDACIATELQWDSHVLSGRFRSPNRRGEQKATVLQQLRAGTCGTTIAYANSASDIAHLLIADQGFLVNGSRRARSMARRAGLQARKWR